jgi:hypothetical protein
MYKLLITPLQTNILRVDDCAVIPMDEANSDYQRYLEWVAEGNTAEEWNPNGN